MANIGVGNFNVYDLRGLKADISSVDTTTIGVGSTYFAIDESKVYMWNGTSWVEV